MPRRKPRRWLFKSEPDEFSFADLCACPERTARWDGVRSYQARNVLQQVRVGDHVLFYHSSTKPPHVAGLAEIVREAYPDPTQFDPDSPYHDPGSPEDAPRWVAVDVRAVEALPRIVTLPEIRANGRLRKMALVNKSRLSVQPVTEAQWRVVMEMADQGSGDQGVSVSPTGGP